MLPENYPPQQITPFEYQGWAFLLFVFIATILILYGFWLIGTDHIVGSRK